jgi:hypothetical protein
MEYKSGRNPRRLYPLLQRGCLPAPEDARGGSRITVKGHPITILETGDRTTVVAFGGRFSPHRSCFRLDLDIPRRHAILQDVIRRQSVSPESACFDDGHDNGSDVVRAVYLLARDRGMRTIEYTDNSSKHCSPESEERLQLADYYTLLMGQTWYESIFLDAGATSVTITFGRTPAQLLVDRQKAAEVSWDTMCGESIVTPVPLPRHLEIDTAASGSARRVLQYLRSLNRRDVCVFLSANLSEFLINSKIASIRGSSWVCVIPQSANIRARRLTRRSSRLNRHRRSTLRGS